MNFSNTDNLLFHPPVILQSLRGQDNCNNFKMGFFMFFFHNLLQLNYQEAVIMLMLINKNYMYIESPDTDDIFLYIYFPS